MKTFKELMEKQLTAAELKKREEIAKAMERENPDMPMDKKMAIATAAAKRVAEGLGKNVVKSVKVGNFRHDLVDTGMGWQVRIYNGDELYDTGLSKNSEQKGLAALEDAVAFTEKQTRTKRQGVAEGVEEELELLPENMDDLAKTAYMHGLKHGREGVGNNMSRAKAEWGDKFKHYNNGFLKGRNLKAKDLQITGQGYGKKQGGVAEGLGKNVDAGDLTYLQEAADPKSPEDYEELARKHAADGQRGTRSGMVYASMMAGRARRAAKILKDGGSQEAAWRHYQGTDVAEGVEEELDEGILDFIKKPTIKIPFTGKQKVTVGGIDVTVTKDSDDSHYGVEWKDSHGKGHYEEIPDFASYVKKFPHRDEPLHAVKKPKDLLDFIKGEVSYWENKTPNKAVKESDELDEGILDFIKKPTIKIPFTGKQKVTVGGIDVTVTKDSDDSHYGVEYYGVEWKDSHGKGHYEEIPDFASYVKKFPHRDEPLHAVKKPKDLLDFIKGEVSYWENKTPNKAVKESDELDEGYSLRTTMSTREYTGEKKPNKQTEYHVVDNKSGKVVGRASINHEGGKAGALRVNLHNGKGGKVELSDKEKGNPQSALNRYAKDNKDHFSNHQYESASNSFLITAKTAEGAVKTFRVRASDQKEAESKFSAHYSMAKIQKIVAESADVSYESVQDEEQIEEAAKVYHASTKDISIDDAVTTKNAGYGYHGQHDTEERDVKFKNAFAKVRKVVRIAGHLNDVTKPNLLVRQYLDSAHGRHLVGKEENADYIKKDFEIFKKAYKPGMHTESKSVDEVVSPFNWKEYAKQKDKEHGDKTKTFHDVKKSSSGTVYTKQHTPDGINKERSSSQASGEPEVKRGRGRPPGKYGSYKERSAETNARAAAKSAASKAANRAKLKEAFDDEFVTSLFEGFADEQDYVDFLDLLQCEEFEQLDELSKSTLGSYVNKAVSGMKGVGVSMRQAGVSSVKGDEKNAEKNMDVAVKRSIGIGNAVKRLTKEDELIGNQHKLDKNKNGKLDAHDFKLLRKEDVELEESEILDEMQQDKEYTHAQLMKKVQSGSWEAQGDIAPGKLVSMRHHSGKTVMVRVKNQPIKEESEQIEESVNIYASFLSKKQ